MKIKRLGPILIGTIAVLLSMHFQSQASGGETAPYQVVRTDGKFELRDYPALSVVEAASGTNADSSFMRLFRFIRGSNATQQKIAMTTPVFMSGSDTNATMAFVMPAKAKVPKPTDSTLMVKEIAAGRFAVLRFRGGRNTPNEAEAWAKLQGWLQVQSLSPLSPPTYGYFDPPWIPGFLRHNEVMLRVQAK